MTHVIVLNGGSSSGKSGIARCLQSLLPGPWLALGTDTLVDALPAAGAHVIVDEVFLGGAGSQERWQKALAGLDVLWVGVRCEPSIAAGREVARGDRVGGMAASQAELVHQGVTYDVVVDTSRTESMECARAIAGHVG